VKQTRRRRRHGGREVAHAGAAAGRRSIRPDGPPPQSQPVGAASARPAFEAVGARRRPDRPARV